VRLHDVLVLLLEVLCGQVQHEWRPPRRCLRARHMLLLQRLHWHRNVLLLLLQLVLVLVLHMRAEVLLLLGRTWEVPVRCCCFVPCTMLLTWALDTTIPRLQGTCTAATHSHTPYGLTSCTLSWPLGDP
jgi:hypothetical protein